MLYDCCIRHGKGANPESERDAIDGWEADLHLTQERIQDAVHDRNEDDDRD